MLYMSLAETLCPAKWTADSRLLCWTNINGTMAAAAADGNGLNDCTDK